MKTNLDQILERIGDIEEIDGLQIKGGFVALGGNNDTDDTNTGCNENCGCNVGCKPTKNDECNHNCDCEVPDPKEN